MEGVRSNPILRGRNQSPWLLTTYPKWDDPPSTVYPMMNRSGERETGTSHPRLSRFLRSSFSRALCIKRKPSEVIGKRQHALMLYWTISNENNMFHGYEIMLTFGPPSAHGKMLFLFLSPRNMGCD